LNRKQTNSKAFTLVEVLVASFIICIFSASFVYLSAVSVKQVITSKLLTRAVFASKGVMEELRSKDFGALLSYNNTTFDNGNGRITVTPVGSDRISITVRNKIELNTLRSRF
jgi:prepilin-type N-terminal cleavage/methylation domain-containing protein